jgi:hypothetical protein
MRSSVPEFQDKLHHSVAKIVDELRTAGYIQPDQDQITGTSLSCLTEGRSVYHIANDLARSKLPAAPFSHFNAQLPPSSQFQAIPIDNNSTRLGAPCVFAKISNRIQKMFENFPFTDGLQVDSLISFLRVLVRIRYMAPAFDISTSQLLQICYGYTKGLLASKTMAAIYRGDTLEAYHQDVLASFIPPRVMLPLSNSFYYRPQRSEDHLSDYIADIKEIAAVLDHDTDEAAVVSTILDGLHPRKRNRLVFCDKPRDYAGLDSMCVYAHSIAHHDQEDMPDPSLRRTPSSFPRPLLDKSLVRTSTVVCYRCNKPGHTDRT